MRTILLTLTSICIFSCGIKKDSFYYFEAGKAELINTNTYEAVRLLTRAIKLKPNNVLAYSYRAAAHMSVDSTARAIQDYDTLLYYSATQKEISDLMMLKGNALYLSLQDSAACKCYRRARDLNNYSAWDKIRKLCK